MLRMIALRRGDDGVIRDRKASAKLFLIQRHKGDAAFNALLTSSGFNPSGADSGIRGANLSRTNSTTLRCWSSRRGRVKSSDAKHVSQLCSLSGGRLWRRYLNSGRGRATAQHVAVDHKQQRKSYSFQVCVTSAGMKRRRHAKRRSGCAATTASNSTIERDIAPGYEACALQTAFARAASSI